MSSASKRFQPYQGEDGDYIRLLNFAHTAGNILDADFNPPKVMLSKDETEGMQDVMHFNKRWGTEQQGFETFHTVELEPKASGQAVDHVKLKTFGLANGARIAMESTRYWYDPRFIEIKVVGPEEGVKQVIADFVEQFGGTKMDPKKLKETMVSAEVSLKAGAWDAAIMKAQMVLELDESQPDAYFIMGAAQMASSDFSAAKENLSRTVELAPNHLHAWFNLAKVHEKLDELVEAINAYQQILSAPPDPESGVDILTPTITAIGELTRRIADQGSD